MILAKKQKSHCVSATLCVVIKIDVTNSRSGVCRLNEGN